MKKPSSAKARFWAAVSHDVRTPANSISLISEVLGRFPADSEFASRIPGLANDLRNNAKSLVDLVGDVLEIVKLESEDALLVEKPAPLWSLVSETLESMRSRIELQGRSLVTHEPRKDIHALVDAFKFSRMIANVLANSLRYSGPGELSVSLIKTQSGEIAVRVSDSGCRATAEEIQATLAEFDILHSQGEASSAGGAGLKLYIATQIAESLHCRIRVSSDENLGLVTELIVPSAKLRTNPPIEWDEVLRHLESESREEKKSPYIELSDFKP